MIKWTKIVQRVLSYNGATEMSPVNLVYIGSKCHYITRSQMPKNLANTVDNMDGLDFTGKELGTHSIRSSLEMALYLAKRPVHTIILIDRWCSDAFFLYVSRQIQEFLLA